MTIRVVAKCHVKPEKVQEFMDMSKKLVDETLKEKGCVEYGLYQDLNNPEVLTMLEEWHDECSLDEHMKSNHFKEIVPLFSECLEKEMEVSIYKKML
ncbi:MAG: putative quinol monooxygenase [Methanosarcina sp.]